MNKLMNALVVRRRIQRRKKENKEAWKRRLEQEQNPSNDDLWEIAIYAPSPIGREAGRKLLQRNPTNQQLSKILRAPSPISEEAGLKLLQQNPTNEDLDQIIMSVPLHRKKAAEKLLQQNPTNKELSRIMLAVPILAQEAWEKLLQQDPNKEELEWIADRIKYGNKVQKIFYTKIQKELKKKLEKS